jgi:hypothetical protein
MVNDNTFSISNDEKLWHGVVNAGGASEVRYQEYVSEMEHFLKESSHKSKFVGSGLSSANGAEKLTAIKLLSDMLVRGIENDNHLAFFPLLISMCFDDHLRQHIINVLWHYPRDFIVDNFEHVAEPLLKNATVREYQAVFSICQELMQIRGIYIAKKGLESTNEEIRACCHNYLQGLSEYWNAVENALSEHD